MFGFGGEPQSGSSMMVGMLKGLGFDPEQIMGYVQQIVSGVEQIGSELKNIRDQQTIILQKLDDLQKGHDNVAE